MNPEKYAHAMAQAMAPAGSLGRANQYVGGPIATPSASSSPVVTQLEIMSKRLAEQYALIDLLISKLQAVTNGDPRSLAMAGGEAITPISCPLEGELNGLADKLDSHNMLLNSVIQRIQL